VDSRRLHSQYGLHSQPVRAQSRPLLVGDFAAQVPQQEDHQESARHDLAGTLTTLALSLSLLMDLGPQGQIIYQAGEAEASGSGPQ